MRVVVMAAGTELWVYTGHGRDYVRTLGQADGRVFSGGDSRQMRCPVLGSSAPAGGG